MLPTKLAIVPGNLRLPTRIPAWVGLVSLFLLTIAVRWYAVSDNQVFFFYDQARDAAIVRDIYLNHDLKIQGPPASGTNETIYHGVAYYYVLAFLYWWLESPFWVTIGLAIINSLTLFPLWALTKAITKSNWISLLTGLLFAVSFESTQTAIWLSNPNLILLSFTLFYYGLWHVCYKQDNRFLPFIALGLGISHQLLIFSFFLYGPLAIGLWYRSHLTHQPVWRFFTRKQLLLSSLLFVCIISSLLLTQAILWQRQIFTFTSLNAATHQSLGQWLNNWLTVGALWVKKIHFSLLPSFPTIVGLFSIFILGYWFKQRPSWRWFGLSWLTAPSWLFLLHPRNAYHAFISVELLIYLALSWVVVNQFRTKNTAANPQLTFQRWFAGLLFVVVAASQLLTLKDYKFQERFLYDVRPGALLSTQLRLIDSIYWQAAGQPFSLSTLSTPYGFNTTWAYLFDWYGQQQYGYVPLWYGPDQTGITAGELLQRTNTPLPLHVAIYESEVGIDPWLYQAFQEQQAEIATASTRFWFGSLSWEAYRAQP